MAAIEEMYHNDGYISATFTDINISQEGILYIELNEGYINEIIIKGNEKTKDYVIRRELDFAEGDVLNIKKIEDSFQKIAGLNIFENIKVDLEVADYLENTYNFIIDISEGKTGEYGATAAWSSKDGFIGSIFINEKNFLGRGQTLAFNWEFGCVTNYSINFYEPKLMSTGLSFGVGLYDRSYKSNI